MVESQRIAQVFIAYAREDEEFKDELIKHLSVLKIQGLISEWHDRKILPGEQWEDEISTKLTDSDIILLLLSADFLSSEYAIKNEAKAAIEKHDAGEAIVVPIILRQVDWENTIFRKFQVLPEDARAVNDWTTRDAAWTSVSRGLRAVAENFQATGQFLLPLLSEDEEYSHFSNAQGSQSALQLYREELEYFADQDGGQISEINTHILEALRESKQISSNAAERLYERVLKPYIAYENVLSKAIDKQYPLSQVIRKNLERLREKLGLSITSASVIEERVLKGKAQPNYLVTESGIDLSNLAFLLKSNQWAAADFENFRIFQALIPSISCGIYKKSERGGQKTRGTWISCADLSLIDQLWVESSSKRFGFSTQFKIFQKLYGELEQDKSGHHLLFNPEKWEAFSRQVGWYSDNWSPKTHDQLIFSHEAPVGHLPSVTCGAAFIWFSKPPGKSNRISSEWRNGQIENKERESRKYLLWPHNEMDDYWGWCLAGEIFEKLTECNIE